MQFLPLLSEGTVLLFVDTTSLPQTPTRTLPVGVGTNYEALQKTIQNRTSIYERITTPWGRDQASLVSQTGGGRCSREDDYVTDTPAGKHNYVFPSGAAR